MRKHHKLQNTVLLSFTILAVVLVLVISLVVGDRYIKGEMENCRTTAYAYTKSAAELIDGDKIAHYLETEEKDEYYYEILDFLNSFRLNTDIQYYYVFVPFENDLVYIWDANALKPDETEVDACELGYHEEYMEGGKEATFSIYKQNPPEEIELVNDDKYGYIASAYSPVFDSNGDPVAVVGVDVYMPDLQANMREFLVVVVAAIFLVVLAAILVCFFFVKRKIVNPINKIRDASKSMVENLENEDSIDVSVKTGNEIEELFDSFKEMYGDVQDYIKKLEGVTAEKERIGAELDVAKHIQASMLPCIFPAFPERSEIDIYATMEPAKEVGGDFYDFFMVDDDHLAVVIADVSGKGVPASLVMSVTCRLFRTMASHVKSPEKIVASLNDTLAENNESNMFCTAFVGILDLQTGRLEYCNAGHNAPVLMDLSGVKYMEVLPNLALGLFEGFRYQSQSCTLEKGNTMFLYTDGVTEAENISKELYSEEHLLEVLGRNNGRESVQITGVIVDDIERHSLGAEQSDDITILCLKYR